MQVDRTRELRGAVYRKDGAAVVRLLQSDGETPWQLAGTLDRESADELSRWFEFAGERKRGRARAWLADTGYRVASLRRAC